MNYYEHNVEDLKKYRRNIYDELGKYETRKNENYPDTVYSETAADGERYMVIQKNKKIYRLNSCYDPSHEAMKWAGQFSFSNLNNVITMFGFGNGVFARELLKKCGKEDFLFIYEPCVEIFLHILKEYDITEFLINSNVILTIEGINEFDFHNLLQNAINITNLFHQTQCTHPYYDELFQTSCVRYWKELKQNLLHTKININTEVAFGKRLITNGFKNLKYVKDSIILNELAQEIQTDVPAIIVAAGPSVKRSLEGLKRAKGKAYIFVVDRILDYVLDHGIEPDFAVTIDPIKPVEYFSKREDIAFPLLCEQVSNYEILDRHKGKKIFYGCHPYFEKMYQAVDKMPPNLSTGASVATAAFSACVWMGFTKIILVGQDLAFEGEYSHAGGIAEKIASDQDLMVEGIDGKPVRSRYDWNEFLIWFKDMLILNPEIKVIDAKDKGAKIQGTQIMPLDEAIDTYCTKETGGMQAINNMQSFTSEDLVKMKEYLEKSRENIKAIFKKAKEALQICDFQIHEYNRDLCDTKLTRENNRKLGKINNYINKQPSYSLLDTYITSLAANDISKLYQFTDDTRNDKLETYERAKKIYEAIISAAEKVLPMLKDSLKYLES